MQRPDGTQAPKAQLRLIKHPINSVVRFPPQKFPVQEFPAPKFPAAENKKANR